MNTTINFDKFEEQVFLNTVLIENLTDGELGTGFLMKKMTTDKASGKFLLFSNKHVFWGKNDWKKEKHNEKVLQLTLHKNRKDGSYVPGEVHKYRLTIDKSDTGYYGHPNAEIDVACLNISDAFNSPEIIPRVRAINEDLLDVKVESLFSGMEIVFIGYPNGFYDKVNFFPVLRSGVIASIPNIDFNGKAQILLDAQVFPGSSGSPVFVKTGNGYKLLGIISEAPLFGQHFIEEDNMSQQKDRKYPVQFIGLGMAYKIETLKAVYDMVSPENGAH